MAWIRFHSDFIQRGITPERETPWTRKKCVSNIFPWGIHIWNFKTLACTVLERTNAHMEGCTDAQPETNMPRQFLRSWGHKKRWLFQRHVCTIQNIGSYPTPPTPGKNLTKTWNYKIELHLVQQLCYSPLRYEPCHKKTCFCHMRTTKVQIKHGAVWSAPLLFAAWIV